jgi:SAM-dependent methyltransferase
MNPEYSQIYRDFYGRHWWWRAREKYIGECLWRHLQRNSDSRVLDVGCGDRLSFRFLGQWGKVFGIEPDVSLLSPESRNDPALHVGSVTDDLPFEGRFHLLTSFDSLEHMEDDRRALARFRDLLDPAGVLAIHVPAWMWLWTGHDEMNRHFRRYSRAEIIEKCELAGFEVLEVRSWFFFTVPLKFLSKMLGGGARKPELPILPPDFLNALLVWYCWIEKRLLGWIPGLPGSSLFVIARPRSPGGCT